MVPAMRLRSLALVATMTPVSLAAQSSAITEWQVPWTQTRPRDPAVAPDGRIWFVGQVGNYVAVLDPRSGAFRRYDIDEGTHPHNVVIGPDGAAWYAGNQNGMIGRLDPATGDLRRFPMPEPDLTDPHTLTFNQAGNLWFTLQGSNAVGYLDTRSGKVRVVRMPGSGSRPYGILLDSKERPWFVEFGANRIGTIDPVSFTLREYTIPDAGARPRRIALGHDDRIYAGDYARGKLVMLDPKSGKITEWQNPAGNRSAPYAMTSDDQGRIWQVETGVQPNRLVSFDPKTESFGTPVPVAPSGGIVVRHMVFDPKTRSIWYGSDAGTIGRVTLSPAAGGAATP
jgi:virginiamycin B lyase